MTNLTVSSVHPDISKYGDASLTLPLTWESNLFSRSSKFTIHTSWPVLQY